MVSYCAYFSQESYARHGLPVVAELRARGLDVRVWGHVPGHPWGPPLVHERDLADIVLVGSAIDAARCRDRAVVYIEHGAGQTYDLSDSDPRLAFGYAGGPGLDHVRMFLCPSARVADRWRTSYPAAHVVVVGDPALDQIVRNPQPMVAVTCHWRSGVCPETQPALPVYMSYLPILRHQLEAFGVELVGHAHPRIGRRLAQDWAALKIRFEPDPDVILTSASLLVYDNTSLAYEAAAVGLPSLALNAPWYRREVDHGLRFWDRVPGLQVDRPDDLGFMVDLALTDPAEAQDLRRHAARYTYSVRDGHSAEYAADAILTVDPTMPRKVPMADWLGELQHRMFLLGATPVEIDQFEEVWDNADSDTRRWLRGLNDVLLTKEIGKMFR